MPDLREKLSELLQRYERDKTKPRTEADVSANFIDHLFAALGWDITNPNEYNRQRYVREAGNKAEMLRQAQHDRSRGRTSSGNVEPSFHESSFRSYSKLDLPAGSASMDGRSSGCSIVVMHRLPKPARWVRFPSPAPTSKALYNQHRRLVIGGLCHLPSPLNGSA